MQAQMRMQTQRTAGNRPQRRELTLRTIYRRVTLVGEQYRRRTALQFSAALSLRTPNILEQGGINRGEWYRQDARPVSAEAVMRESPGGGHSPATPYDYTSADDTIMLSTTPRKNLV